MCLNGVMIRDLNSIASRDHFTVKSLSSAALVVYRTKDSAVVHVLGFSTNHICIFYHVVLQHTVNQECKLYVMIRQLLKTLLSHWHT